VLTKNAYVIKQKNTTTTNTTHPQFLFSPPIFAELQHVSLDTCMSSFCLPWNIPSRRRQWILLLPY